MSNPAGNGLRRWLREPLLHFALIGGLLFAVYARMNPADVAPQRIVVTRLMVADLARQHELRWLRPATEQELANLVEAHVRDEIQYREGLALGLDRDDPVIKRRVRQKLELMTEEQAAGAAPTDAELSAFMAQNPARFTLPGTVSFEQIYFDGSATPPEVERAIATARAALARGADPSALGLATMLPRSLDKAPIELIARDFGARFAEQVAALPTGEWVGPVASSLGAHLVRVAALTPPVTPPLDAIRQQLAREWENERRERSRAETYRKLRSGYEVLIEPMGLPAAAPPP